MESGRFGVRSFALHPFLVTELLHQRNRTVASLKPDGHGPGLTPPRASETDVRHSQRGVS